jgi:hypothetical protein
MEFKCYLKRALLFASPLLLWMLAIVAVDPFNYFGVSRLFPEKVKIENAADLNNLLFNMLKHVRHPGENLIIGDSRAEALPQAQIEELTGRRYSKLVGWALKMDETIDLFYFANKIQPVRNVIFTLNFNEYNERANSARVTSVEGMIHNPLLYFFDRNVAQAAYYVAKASLTHEKSFSSIPPMGEEAFWNYIVTVRGRDSYEHFRYPDALYQRMQKMVAFARAQGTEVTYILVPVHADFQKRVREFGLNDQYLRFKRDLSQLGARVVDYDFVSDITTNRANFRDPVHYTEVIGKLIADEVFRGPLLKGRLLDADWARQCENFLF